MPLNLRGFQAAPWGMSTPSRIFEGQNCWFWYRFAHTYMHHIDCSAFRDPERRAKLQTYWKRRAKATPSEAWQGRTRPRVRMEKTNEIAIPSDWRRPIGTHDRTGEAGSRPRVGLEKVGFPISLYGWHAGHTLSFYMDLISGLSELLNPLTGFWSPLGRQDPGFPVSLYGWHADQILSCYMELISGRDPKSNWRWKTKKKIGADDPGLEADRWSCKLAKWRLHRSWIEIYLYFRANDGDRKSQRLSGPYHYDFIILLSGSSCNRVNFEW